MRINKYFTEHGICSRREADRVIEGGRVSIDGKIAKLGDQVPAEAEVRLDGKVVGIKPKKPIILAYNKPVGIVCTSDSSIPDNIIDAVNFSERVFHIGRLDQMSEGLILLTNLGQIVNRILRSRYGNEKEYVVEANEAIADKDIRRLSQGVVIMGRMTLPCQVSRLGVKRIKMILTEGRNRQIRRMIESLGLRVTRLKRVRIMNVALGDIPKGQWRKLSSKELHEMYKLLEVTEAEVLGMS